MKRKQARNQKRKFTSHDFLASMSHEIRTPINGILGISSILQEMNMPEDQKKFIKLINNSVQSLLSLINDILDFSKIEAGKMPLLSTKFCLKDELDNIIETFKPIADKKKIDLSFTVNEKQNLYFVGDVNRVKQILLNLIGNGLKFTEKGQVHIDVNISFKSEEKAVVRFKVSDTGIGIQEDKLLTLFNPYIQAHDIRANGAGGTGLGLYISKKLVEMMGGRIFASSTYGQGSEFVFEIPLMLAKNMFQENKKKRPSSFKASGRILLAEDNFINQMVTEKFLKKSGFEVVVVNNGKEAIETLDRDQGFDLVLMDCHMPILDGYSATTMIRKSGKSYSEIPILALSASVLKQEQDQCRLVGMNDFISKPVTFETLEGKLKEWFAQSA